MGETWLKYELRKTPTDGYRIQGPRLKSRLADELQDVPPSVSWYDQEFIAKATKAVFRSFTLGSVMIRRCSGTTRRALSPRTVVRPQCRCLATDRKDTIPLAYDLHLPPSKAEYDPAQPTPAVVLMHGVGLDSRHITNYKSCSAQSNRFEACHGD